MARSKMRFVPGLFAVVACLVTALAAWAAFRATRSTLGLVGALLTALAAAMIVGAPFYIATVLIWTRDSQSTASSLPPAGSGPRRRS
jgi:ornithine cyclodeaminase/alanine dehydrogenase-like protein (mu-crystallin family)